MTPAAIVALTEILLTAFRNILAWSGKSKAEAIVADMLDALQVFDGAVAGKVTPEAATDAINGLVEKYRARDAAVDAELEKKFSEEE